jgi:hypothetical protein
MANARKPKSNGGRQTVSPALANLGDLVVIQPIRSDGVDLTLAERKFLDDPNWITEDEADAIMAERILPR